MCELEVRVRPTISGGASGSAGRAVRPRGGPLAKCWSACVVGRARSWLRLRHRLATRDARTSRRFALRSSARHHTSHLDALCSRRRRFRRACVRASVADRRRATRFSHAATAAFAATLLNAFRCGSAVSAARLCVWRNCAPACVRLACGYLIFVRGKRDRWDGGRSAGSHPAS